MGELIGEDGQRHALEFRLRRLFLVNEGQQGLDDLALRHVRSPSRKATRPATCRGWSLTIRQ